VLLTGLALFFLLATARIGEHEIAREIEAAIRESHELMQSRLPEITNFDEFDNEAEGFNIFVYNENDQLVFWSDHGYAPKIGVFDKKDSLGVIVNNSGIFLFDRYRSAEATIIGLIPIERKYSNSNQYLHDIYNLELIHGNVEITNQLNAVPIFDGGKQLFSIRSRGSVYFSANTYLLFGLLSLVFLASLFLFLYQSFDVVKSRFGLYTSVFAYASILILVRLVFQYYSWPRRIIALEIFDPKTFHFGWYFQSLGDALLNTLCAILLIGFLVQTDRKLLIDALSRYNFFNSWLFRLLLAISASLSLVLFFESIILILDHSQVSMDINKSLDFDQIRLASYGLLFLMAALFFLIHMLVFEFLKGITEREHFKIQLATVAVIIPVFYGLSFIWIAGVVNLAYSLVLFRFRLPETLKDLRFGSVNYLIISAIVLAVLGSFAIYKSSEKSELVKKQKFATHLMIDRDFDGEYRLSKIIDQIRQDVIVNSHMINPQLRAENLVKWIKRTYINTYFSNYDISIALFDEGGNSLSEQYLGSTFDQINAQYLASALPTEYENIYYDSQFGDGERRKYACLITLERYGINTGYMEIVLQLNRASNKRVFPLLLMDRNLTDMNEFDYAIYIDDRIMYHSGEFNYDADFDNHWMSYEGLHLDGIEKNGYHHIAVKSGKRTIVITGSDYPLTGLVVNFSFFFMFFVSAAGLVFLLLALMDRHRVRSLNFSTKILLFSGATFIIPLLLVAIAVLTTTDRSYRKEIDKSNLKRTVRMSANLNRVYHQYLSGTVNKERLESAVSDQARYAGIDVNIFNTDGKLMGSSTPQIFDQKILSAYLNPKAVVNILKDGQEQMTIEECVGQLKYKSSFVALLDPDSGLISGVLESPYFGIKNHQRRQQLEVFGNIINIFTFVLIIAIGFAYVVIRRLTKPIVVIAERLHDTGFVESNLPIEWHTDDEIGVLVNEYNNMLKKLDASRQELARNEKEAAWREMAKQVAHEIKNPLTPMKLTIQHLQRILSDRKEEKKSLEIVLSQIDTLDEIVTSFSHFAKMPTPEKEPFDLKKTLEKSVDLHLDQNIIKALASGEFIVLGDQKLFGRIFNNLILNATHALKTKSSPQIIVSLTRDKNKALLEFHDNGTGISEDIRDLVFVPNFSTKDSGSGIGLAVAKRGIEHAGGKIWFESTAGKGTSFFIELALVQLA